LLRCSQSLLEFFILTPLPGPTDHQKLHLAGVEMDSDMNRYDLVHVYSPSTMSDEELLAIYQKAWDRSAQHDAQAANDASSKGRRFEIASTQAPSARVSGL